MNKTISKLLYPQKPMLGLDVGASYVKLMEISGDSLEDAKLERYCFEEIPQELANNYDIADKVQKMSELIKRCWRASGTKTKNVALALSNSAAITKKVMVPIMPEEDLREKLEQEVTKYLPSGITVNEISLDYSILGINEENPTEYDVMLVAAKKEKIEEKIAAVEGAGLIPCILDVEQYALQNMLRLLKGEEFDQKTYLILDCSAAEMRMMVFKNGFLQTSRDVQFGGAGLTRDLATSSGISFEQAEKIKIFQNFDDTGDVLTKGFVQSMASEFLGAFQYFVSSASNPIVDEMLLIGGCAGLPGVEAAFRKALLESGETNVLTEPYIPRPLRDAEKDSKINLFRLGQDEPGMFLVTALALRKFLRQY